MLNRRLGGSAFCWVLAFSTTSCHQQVSESTGSTEGPFGRVWLSLPHLVSNSSFLQLPDFLLSLSYIIVQSSIQSPTQSLEWHVWLSSSGNNCHAVQRSLSSGVSVYECIMGFYLVPFHLPNLPTRFLSITGHWNVSLPSGASLWNRMFGRVEGQYTTLPPHWVHYTCFVPYQCHFRRYIYICLACNYMNTYMHKHAYIRRHIHPYACTYMFICR